jgi:hypothetical protein
MDKSPVDYKSLCTKLEKELIDEKELNLELSKK